MNLMSQTEFAKHIGKDRSYVTQLKTAGRLILQDGKVNVEASIARIEETKDPSKIGVSERHKKEREQKQTVINVTQNSDYVTEKITSYQDARAMKETYNAKQAKLAYEKEIGLLLVAEEAKQAVANGDTIIRNRLESLPDTLAPQLAAEENEQKIRTMLIDHIEAILSDLSRSFYTLAKS